MKKVTGIGGVFIKSADPAKQREWYNKHLGINSSEYGATFEWIDKESNEPGMTVLNFFKDSTKYFDPSTKECMFNYRVENLEELMESLKQEGVQIVGGPENTDYGKFGWILDPEGNKIELWQP
ncbi:MAG: VOC family protein [Bacteroidetes bacterium]|nr:VOC family protein [Bacteroidota bacterium]